MERVWFFVEILSSAWRRVWVRARLAEQDSAAPYHVCARERRDGEGFATHLEAHISSGGPRVLRRASSWLHPFLSRNDSGGGQTLSSLSLTLLSLGLRAVWRLLPTGRRVTRDDTRIQRGGGRSRACAVLLRRRVARCRECLTHSRLMGRKVQYSSVLTQN